MRWSEALLFYSLLGLGYLVGPIAVAWGWMEVFHRLSEPRTWPYSISLAGLMAVTASAALGILLILYAMGGAFEHYDHMKLFYRWIAAGIVLSVFGFLLAIGGVWKRHRIRWQAPVAALGTFAFWLLATTWP